MDLDSDKVFPGSCLARRFISSFINVVETEEGVSLLWLVISSIPISVLESNRIIICSSGERLGWSFLVVLPWVDGSSS